MKAGGTETVSGESPRIARSDQPYESVEALQRRRNRRLLLILVAVIAGLVLASYFLMNNWYDPYLSATTSSH